MGGTAATLSAGRSEELYFVPTSASGWSFGGSTLHIVVTSVLSLSLVTKYWLPAGRGRCGCSDWTRPRCRTSTPTCSTPSSSVSSIAALQQQTCDIHQTKCNKQNIPCKTPFSFLMAAILLNLSLPCGPLLPFIGPAETPDN